MRAAECKLSVFVDLDVLVDAGVLHESGKTAIVLAPH